MLFKLLDVLLAEANREDSEIVKSLRSSVIGETLPFDDAGCEVRLRSEGTDGETIGLVIASACSCVAADDVGWMFSGKPSAGFGGLLRERLLVGFMAVQSRSFRYNKRSEHVDTHCILSGECCGLAPLPGLPVVLRSGS